MRSRIRRLLFLVLLAASLAGCASRIVYLPTPTAISMGPERPTETPIPNSTPQPQLLERRKLVLEWPETIREKDSSLIVLTIAMDAQGQATATVSTAEPPSSIPVEIPNLYDTHHIFAIARLDLAGVEAY